MTTTPQNLGQEMAAWRLDRITEALREHQMLGVSYPGAVPFGCSCGWRPAGDRDPVDHQAAMVAVAAGIARLKALP